MSTSIQQAIATVLERNESLTIANVLAAYLKILGYMATDATETDMPQEALVAFEHALDKEPVLSRRRATATCVALCKRMYTAEITQLRKEYWRERLGAIDAVRCTCPSCGNTVSYTREDPESQDAEAKGTPKRVKDGQRRVKARRVANYRRDLPRSDPPRDRDPYAPSTSALVL